MDRISLLKQYATETPDDPFNFYAIALEYLKINPAEAKVLFEKLTVSHPNYLPTYYPYAQLLAEQKQIEKAEEIFKKGIEMARANGDTKTLHEIQAAYRDWKYELEA